MVTVDGRIGIEEGVWGKIDSSLALSHNFSRKHAKKEGAQEKMTRIQSIENEVRKLSKPELAQFRKWFEEYEAEAWAREIERDVASGKLDKLAQNALEDYKAGKCKPL